MKSTRRLLSIILCLVMCLSLLPTAFAADDDIISSGKANPAGTAEFVLYKSGKLVISGTGWVYGMEQWSFSNGYNFTNDDVKATRSETKTLVVEQGITSLLFAFRNCANLTSVTLPTSLTSIGQYSFMNCSGLREISIPGNVSRIGSQAFKGCTGLTTVNLSTGLQEIGEEAFEDCTKLVSIMIPSNVTAIGENAFKNCGKLKTITFQCNYVDGLIDETAFAGVTATAYYPVDNNSWNNDFFGATTPPAGYPDFGGRLTWKPAAAPSHSDGWVKKGSDWYFYMDGEMLISSWKAYGGKWYYFGADGKMVTGRTQIDGDYYYFGQGSPKDTYSLGARVSGLVTDPDDGNDYFYDENGVWQPSYYGVDDTGIDYMVNGWQQPQTNGKWFFIRNKAKVTGWLYWNGYWYYLDPVTGAMVTGWLTWKGNTYYLRPLQKAIDDGIPTKEGSMIAGRSSNIGGTVYTFDNSGALQGGKIDENPGNIATGFRNEGSPSTPVWKFYRSNGTMAKGWELIDNNWYLFDNNGKMLTGWQKVGGVWYYLTKWWFDESDSTLDVNNSADWEEIDLSVPATGKDLMDSNAGKMVTGFNKIPYTMNGTNTVRTYFFKSSGALNGNGWIKVGLKWYYLEAKGEVRTGWFRDGSKWYYLLDSSDPIGEMVTGTYVTPTLPDGSANTADQYFAPSGEWLGDSPSPNWASGKAGAWAKHDGYWYYYDANGDDYKDGNNNAVTGWINYNGKWYYLSLTGSTDPKNPPEVGYMLTGWQDLPEGRFYFDTVNGDAKGGWQKIDGVWYYMYPNHDGQFGKMMTGWQFINGNWYHFNEDTGSSSYGALQDGWIKKTANDKDSTLYWFYLEENQSSSTYGALWGGGWKQIGGKWYFFDNQHIGYYGKLISGKWIKTDGKWYFVRPEVPDHPEESYMVTGLVDVPSAGNFPDDSTTWPGGTYYFDGNGAYQPYTGWQKINGSWYYFDAGTHTAVKDAWINEGSNTYRLGPDGKMLTGWQTIGSDEYYFDPGDGHAWKNADMDGQHLGWDGKKV